jgi:phosphoribosylanthranilate isomerase
MTPLVYIRDVNNLSDARYCAAMGVDMIGFRLDPLKTESLSPAKCKEIAGWISGIKIVGEFGLAPSEFIRDVLAVVNIDYILAESGSDFNNLASFEKPLIIQISVDDLKSGRIAGINQPNARYFLLTSYNNTADIPTAKQLNVALPLILGYGINEANVSTLVNDYGFAGISLTAGSEERPGYKDYDEMADILEVLQGA